jgi:hypothetical protein
VLESVERFFEHRSDLGVDREAVNRNVDRQAVARNEDPAYGPGYRPFHREITSGA